MAHELSIEALRLIRASGLLTRGELASRLDISPSLVSKIVTGLIERGLLEERTAAEPANGRPAVRLAIRPTAGYFIGIDIGSPYQTAVVTNLAGDVVAGIREPSPNWDFSPACQEELTLRILKKAGITPDQVLGYGGGLRHIVDGVNGVVYRYTNPYSQTDTAGHPLNEPVRDELVRRLSFPHIIVDDVVRALGVAEARYGLGVGVDNFVYLLSDTGIGLAIMHNGMPYIGASHIAGEIAHVPVGDPAQVCNCGNSGCTGLFAGVGYVLVKVHQLLADSMVRSSLRGKQELTIEDVVEAGERGDKLAIQALAEAGGYMGMAMAVVLNMYGPRMTVAGGCLMKSSIYRSAANWQMRLRALQMVAQGIEIQLTSLDDLAGARGAATLAIDAMFTPGEKDILHLAKQ